MRNPWYRYTDAGKFVFFSGILIVGYQLYECLSRGLPENFDELLSFTLYLIIGSSAIYWGLKQQLPKSRYEVIQTSQYGTRTYGPYETYAEAEFAVEKFEEIFFDESFYEIKIASIATYDGKHQRELMIYFRNAVDVA